MILAIVALGVAGQASAPKAGSYLFIETPRVSLGGVLKEGLSPGTGQISKVRDKLTGAGEEGYALQLLSRRSLSLSMLLKHDGLGPRTYRVVTANNHESWLKELNEAAAQGFRLVPGGAKIFNRYEDRFKEQWVAVIVQQSADEPW